MDLSIFFLPLVDKHRLRLRCPLKDGPNCSKANQRCTGIRKARLHRRFLSRNSMQFLSRRSCNFNIARVNQLRFQRDFIAATSQEF